MIIDDFKNLHRAMDDLAETLRGEFGRHWPRLVLGYLALVCVALAVGLP